jgi:hypothetical protein
MKNKRAKKLTMKDMMNEGATVKPDKVKHDDSIQIGNKYFTSEYNEKLITYNKDIGNFSDKYTKIRPSTKVLIRAFVNPMQEENGVIIPNKTEVRAQTKNGVGTLGTIENPFPFLNKAVIVNIPSIINPELKALLEVGDVVSINQTLVQARPIGSGNNAAITLDNRYVHPDEVGKYDGGVVTEPDDPNYGYFLIDPYSIEVILEKVTL